MKLVVETGAEIIELEDASTHEIIGSFRYNPADTNIIRRYDEVAAALENMQIPDKAEDDGEMIKKFEDFIYKQLDYLLGYPVSKDIFKIAGALSPLKDKDEFFFEQVLEGIGNLISQTMDTRLKAKADKIRGATEGYAEK